MSILERCSYWRGIGIRGVYKEGCPYSIYQRDVHIREVFLLEVCILERCSYWRGIGIRGVYKEGCPYTKYQRDVRIREAFVLEVCIS